MLSYMAAEICRQKADFSMRTVATHPFRLHSVSPGQIDRVSKRSAVDKAMLTMANEEEPGHGAVVGGGHGVLAGRGDGERVRGNGRRNAPIGLRSGTAEGATRPVVIGPSRRRSGEADAGVGLRTLRVSRSTCRTCSTTVSAGVLLASCAHLDLLINSFPSL